jgi:hypothetical protein
MTKLIAAFRNFANVPKNCKTCSRLTSDITKYPSSKVVTEMTLGPLASHAHASADANVQRTCIATQLAQEAKSNDKPNHDPRTRGRGKVCCTP